MTPAVPPGLEQIVAALVPGGRVLSVEALAPDTGAGATGNAFLPEEEREDLLKEAKLHFHGAPERLDRERLERELEACRRDGFALDLGEMKPGLNSVAVPVFGADGAPTGYIALVGLLTAEEARAFGPRVVEAGKALSRRLGARVE